MNLIADDINLDAYFEDQTDEGAKIKPASTWADAVIDRFYGQGAPVNWKPTGLRKLDGNFELRPGELTIWAGVNGHGKTTLLSQVMLHVMQSGDRVCMASMEMKPADTMAKMCRQAAGTGSPSVQYIRNFHRWTDGKLWVYDHLGRLATKRALAVATYARKELKIDHVVIDSLMKCGIGVEDLTGQKDFVDGLCTIARDTGVHIHLVAHMRKGENERMAPGKFDVKGAGEVTDLIDNLVILWKNVRKGDGTEKAQQSTDPDAYMRIAKQRHHPWEGSIGLWFDPGSQQLLEHQNSHPRSVDLSEMLP